MLNLLVIIPDLIGVSLMGGVAIWGLRYFAYLMREPEIRNLRYIWIPNIVSFSFFFALVLIMFLNDTLSAYRTPYYVLLHVVVLVGSGFFALGMFRFIKTIRSHIESKKKAQASLEQIQREITRRLEIKDATSTLKKQKDGESRTK